jgi:hypothetical protein
MHALFGSRTRSHTHTYFLAEVFKFLVDGIGDGFVMFTYLMY